jgi:hypothetical protein
MDRQTFSANELALLFVCIRKPAQYIGRAARIPWRLTIRIISLEENLMADFDIGAIVRDLHDARQQWRQAHRPAGEVRGMEFPSRDALAEIVAQLKGVLFPMRLGPPGLRQESEDFHVAHALDSALHALLRQVQIELRYSAALQQRTDGDIASQALAATRRPSAPRCRTSACRSTATCWPPTRATRPRAASTKCCCATPACWP